MDRVTWEIESEVKTVPVIFNCPVAGCAHPANTEYLWCLRWWTQKEIKIMGQDHSTSSFHVEREIIKSLRNHSPFVLYNITPESILCLNQSVLEFPPLRPRFFEFSFDWLPLCNRRLEVQVGGLTCSQRELCAWGYKNVGKRTLWSQSFWLTAITFTITILCHI